MNALSEYIDNMINDDERSKLAVKKYLETLKQQAQSEERPVLPELGSIPNKIEQRFPNRVENAKCENENKAMYGRASKVRIHNPEDAVEVAIKNNIETYVPYKSWNEIFSIIGKDVLHDAGILDLKQSFYKRKAQELLSHYGVFALTGGTKYERCCTVLYEKPKFDIEIITEGNRFYRDRGVPLLLRFLMKSFEVKGNKIYCTPEMIAVSVGMVNSHFDRNKKDLMEMHPKLTEGIVHQFYLYTSPELDKVVYGLLDEVQNNYKAIRYEKLHWIKTDTGEIFCTDNEQEQIIKEAENYVLQKDFHTDRISTVFYRKKADVFYAAVIKHINQTHNLGWASYKKTIQINSVNEERFLKLCMEMQSDAEVLRKLALEINQRFHDRVRRKIYAEYDRTNKKADKEMENYLATLDDNPVYQKYLSWFIPHEIAVKKAEPKLFRVHPNCYEYQDILMDIVLKI